MRIIHTADLHLRNTADERWEALRSVVEVTRTSGDILVVAGDLFDRDIYAQNIKAEVRALFESLQNPVLIISGNHDCHGMRDGDFFGANVTLFAGEPGARDFAGVRFVGLPFREGGIELVWGSLAAAADLVDPDRANVLIYHGELLDLIPDQGAFGDEGEHEYMPVRLSMFAGLGFDYVLAGHFHRSYGVYEYPGGQFVYSGSPVSITRRETGRRNVDLVVVGQTPSALPVDSRHFVDIEIALSPFDECAPADRVREELARLHPMADASISIGGLVNLEKLGCTETDLHDELAGLVQSYPSVTAEHRWYDVSVVLENDVFRRFNRKLEHSDLPQARIEAVRNMTISAFMEALHAR